MRHIAQPSTTQSGLRREEIEEEFLTTQSGFRDMGGTGSMGAPSRNRSQLTVVFRCQVFLLYTVSFFVIFVEIGR